MDRYVEIKRYVEAQLSIFKMIPIYSEFNDGIIEGFNLMKLYIDRWIEDEGAKIAEACDVKV